MTRMWALTVLLIVAGSTWADEVRTISGKVVSGKTTAISDGEIVITTAAGDVRTPLSQVIALDLRPAKGIAAGTKYTDVRLVDDTILHCQNVAFLGKEMELTLLSGIKLKLPLAFVTWLVRDAQEPKIMAQWEKILAAKIRGDRVAILRDGDLNALEGTLSTVDTKEQTITFTREGGISIPAKLDKLHGLFFFRPDPPTETPLCRVFDSQGNTLAAAGITFKGDTFELKTTFGAMVELKVEAVARIDFNMGKLAFLSDMDPTRVVEKSRLGFVEPYRRDLNLDGQPILLDRSYGKGLSMHAYTELDYNLQGKFKQFKAVLGVDSRVGTSSQARVAIYLDGSLKFNETVSGKVLPIVLDVKGVSTLRIVVSSPDFFGLGDHATLADPQVTK